MAFHPQSDRQAENFEKANSIIEWYLKTYINIHVSTISWNKGDYMYVFTYLYVNITIFSVYSIFSYTPLINTWDIEFINIGIDYGACKMLMANL